VLGAAGRTGRAVARQLHEFGLPLVLAGHDRASLQALATALDEAPRVFVGTLEETLAELAHWAPSVVFNTVGPFDATALRVARACPPGTHYVDVSAELPAAQAILAMDDEARATGRVLVTGAGFGVLATESVALQLCAGRPPAARVRVDAMASLDIEAGRVGRSLAATGIGSAVLGGREVRQGRLVQAPIARLPRRLTSPDGDVVGTASGATSELLAAWRASGAPEVLAATGLVPTAGLAHALLPALSALVRLPGVAPFAVRGVARIPLRAQARPRAHSWAHARIEWPDGEVREGWLRAGDAMEFTVGAAAGVIRRLVQGEGQPGAYTPGALFGPELAEEAGGRLITTSPRAEQLQDSAASTGGRQMFTNTAAWFTPGRADLKVEAAPYTPPRAHEIVVRTHAVSINPVDWLLPYIGRFAYPWLRSRTVAGTDLAGEVVEVGPEVTRFRVGDRVLALAVGTEKSRNAPAEGAFQQYAVVLDHLTSPIPDGLSYEQAAVLPLGLSTAASGLFQKDQLALAYPSASPEPTGQTLLVWGGATSVGSNAIQLAVAAGYEVVTTASPRNFDYVKALGASQAFDYRSKTVVPDLIAALRGKTLAGALAIATGSATPCLEVVRACTGRRFVSTASTPVSFEALAQRPRSPLLLPRLMAGMVAGLLAQTLRARRGGTATKAIWGGSLMNDEVGPLIFETFLPAALAEGRYMAAPEPQVVGHGLEAVQRGFEVQRQGVSARKVVVSLE